MQKEIISIVIPAFNEEKNIKQTYNSLTSIMKKTGSSYEIIFVDDGSKDNTLRILKDLSQKDKSVKYISLSRNFGQQASISAGLDFASGNAVITLDCDLQDPPKLIPDMIAKWRSGYKIVYAKRKDRHDRFFKKYTARAYYSLLDILSNVKIPKEVGDFRLIDCSVLEILKKMPERSRYLRGMVAWTGFRYCFIEYERFERKHGQTGFTMKKMARLATDGLFNFSDFPLSLPIYFCIIAISLSFMAILMFSYNFISSNALILIMLLIFSSVQFFILWIFGEYISRIYEEARGRPLYVINETNISRQ